MSYVYFVTDGEYLKVGFSKSPKSRVKGLQTANPRELRTVAIIEGDELKESEIHARLNAHHVRGEWFRHCEEVDRLISIECEEYRYRLAERARESRLIEERLDAQDAIYEEWNRLEDASSYDYTVVSDYALKMMWQSARDRTKIEYNIMGRLGYLERYKTSGLESINAELQYREENPSLEEQRAT
jgi:hypothetical protein